MTKKSRFLTKKTRFWTKKPKKHTFQRGGNSRETTSKPLQISSEIFKTAQNLQKVHFFIFFPKLQILPLSPNSIISASHHSAIHTPPHPSFHHLPFFSNSHIFIRIKNIIFSPNTQNSSSITKIHHFTPFHSTPQCILRPSKIHISRVHNFTFN